MMTSRVVQTAFFKHLLVTAFCASCLLLGQTVAKAQEDENSTLDDILENAGSIDDALNGLFTLFDDFSFENFASFACSSATAANGIEGSEDSGTAQDIACAIAALPEEIEALLESYETIIQGESKEFYTSIMSFATGSENYLSADQIAEFAGRWDQALENYEDPETFIEETSSIIADSSVAENANYEDAPEGSIEADFNEAMTFNPTLRASYGTQQIREAEVKKRDALSVMGVMESANASEISTMTSQYQDELMDYINEEAAPALREDAATAVSTRAVAQTLVDAVTVFMQQEVTSDANLSKQLSVQAQQQMYTNHELHLLVQSLSQEQLREIQAQQTAIKNMVSQKSQQNEDSVVTASNMGLTLTQIDDRIDIETRLFDPRRW